MATRKALVVINGLLQELPSSDSLTGAIPAGGSTGQKLVKNSGADYDGRWADDPNPVWGEIGGTLASQTDLQSAINARTLDSTLATVAKTGQYGDLSGAPTLLSDFTQDSLHRTVTDAEKGVWNAGGAKPRAAVVSATFADEDTSQTVDVADATVTTLTQFSIDYRSEDFAIQNVQAHVLSVSAGVGYTVIVIAPDGATGQIDLIVTAEEAA